MRTSNLAARGRAVALVVGVAACLAGCGDDAVAGALGADGGAPTDPGAGSVGTCSGSVHSAAVAAAAPPSAPALTVAAGFSLESIASVPHARELVALPNGDLLAATLGDKVYLVPNADVVDVVPGAPAVFATVGDAPAQGIAFSAATCTVFVGTQHGVFRLPYSDAQAAGTIGPAIASVRSGNVVHTASDTDTHTTTALDVAGGMLYAGVGSSCNACTESDPTRATIQGMQLDGAAMATRATRFRNAIALTENPTTHSLWAGGANQDGLALGHPYEFFDRVTGHAAPADYGWPECEENNHAYVAGASCASTVAPLIELPAYSTIIGAAFYPPAASGAFAFPASYRGGLFLTAHGSWHTESDGTYYSPPRVVFVAMNGDAPATPVSWSNPSAQWSELVGGFQLADGKSRVGRPAGIAVGALGSLFVSDDQTNQIYRIRPLVQ